MKKQILIFKSNRKQFLSKPKSINIMSIYLTHFIDKILEETNKIKFYILKLNPTRHCSSIYRGSPPPVPVPSVTLPPAAVSYTKASFTPLTPPLVAVSPTTSGEFVITDTTILEVDVEMTDANAVHKEARGNKRRISPKALKSKSSDIRPFKKHKKN